MSYTGYQDNRNELDDSRRRSLPQADPSTQTLQAHQFYNNASGLPVASAPHDVNQPWWANASFSTRASMPNIFDETTTAPFHQAQQQGPWATTMSTASTPHPRPSLNPQDTPRMSDFIRTEAQFLLAKDDRRDSIDNFGSQAYSSYHPEQEHLDQHLASSQVAFHSNASQPRLFNGDQNGGSGSFHPRQHEETMASTIVNESNGLLRSCTLAIPEIKDPASNLQPLDSPVSESSSSQPSLDKKKAARRQGVTCDQCRTKHLRCDLDSRRADAANSSSPERAELAFSEMKRSLSTGTVIHQIICSRCDEKGLVCTKTHAPPSRRYPRPSRTGKRIEQARIIHGTSAEDIAAAKAASSHRINNSIILIRALTELRGAEVRITDRVMAGSLSLQLLNCFFATCHMQAPVVDFVHFSKVFNAANGDPRKMSIMCNGGSEAEGLPSHIPKMAGMDEITWPGTKESKIGTPGSTETLIAVLHAWAAHYTDAPVAFGSEFKDLDSSDNRLLEVDDDGIIQPESSLDQGTGEAKAGNKRPKRKQGVACDTCRLRRVRCDITERPEGMGCSRCEDKRIKCTDDYIQTKKAKLLAKSGRNGKQEPSLEESLAASEASSADADKLSPRTWISTKRQGLMRSYRPGDLQHNLRRGHARKPFCHALLNHALSLVHKYNILQKPSLESVQILCLLAPLLDFVDGLQAHVIHDTAASHCEKLGISTKLVVDETDRNAVENMLSIMQSNRAYLTAWCRDAIISGLSRRSAYFKQDRAIEVIGQASFRKEPSPVGNDVQAQDRTQHSGKAEVVLSGEMGLTFVIMTMVQIGALSRFVANHIDNVEGTKPSIMVWQRPAGSPMTPNQRPQRFSERPSLAEIRKLERACGAVWNSLDSLMLFFDRCAAKAKTTLDSLQPFRPLGWIGSTKICGTLLYLTIFRALGERHRSNTAYMAKMVHLSGSQDAISDEDRVIAGSLKTLFDKSMQRAIASSRKTARLIEVLLPLGILQTGGPITKQIFPIAQFLAKIPSVPEPTPPAGESRIPQKDSKPVTESSSSSHPAIPPTNFVDPQDLHQRPLVSSHTASASGSTSRSSPDSSGISDQPTNVSPSAQGYVLRELEGMHRIDLGPYTHSAKKREVDALIEGLSQLGYAWDTMQREINAIRDILKSSIRHEC